MKFPGSEVNLVIRIFAKRRRALCNFSQLSVL